jgi:hypothetical protein
MLTAYTFGVLVLALGGQVEHDLIGSSNALLNGAVLALFPVVLGLVGIVAKVPSSRRSAHISGGDGDRRGRVQPAVRRRFGNHQRCRVVASLRERTFGSLSRGLPSMAAVALVLVTWGLGFAVDLGAAAVTIMSIATLVLAVATRADSAPRPEIATQAHSAISCASDQRDL